MLTAYILYIEEKGTGSVVSLLYYMKNTRQIPVLGHSTEYLISTPQNCPVIKIKERLRHCHSSQEGPGEPG